MYVNEERVDCSLKVFDRLRSAGLLDGEREARFDRLTLLIKDVIDVPIVLISIADQSCQFFKSSVGLSEHWAALREAALNQLIYQYAAQSNDILVIKDTKIDAEPGGDLSASDHGVAAFLGVPIYLDRVAVGALCVIDLKPREWTTQEISRLISFAAAVDNEIEISDLTNDSQHKMDVMSAAKVQAMKASNAKTDFIASISHEVRSPLTAVLGYSDLMLEEGTTPRQSVYLKELQSAAELISTLMEETLDLSMIEAGASAIAKEPFSLRALIVKADSIVRLSAEEKGLNLRTEVDSALPEVILGDESRLHQVLLNLLTNAVKFTRKGSVTLRVKIATEDKTSICFEVTDTGIGIDADNQSRIFHRFSQADPSVQREFGGSGLGLFISERLVKLMGGTIGFESSLGCGSTFWFTLKLRTPLVAQKDAV